MQKERSPRVFEVCMVYGRLLEEDGIKKSESTFGMFDFYELGDIFGSKRIDSLKRNEEDFEDYAELNRQPVKVDKQRR